MSFKSNQEPTSKMKNPAWVENPTNGTLAHDFNGEPVSFERGEIIAMELPVANFFQTHLPALIVHNQDPATQGRKSFIPTGKKAPVDINTVPVSESADAPSDAQTDANGNNIANTEHIDLDALTITELRAKASEKGKILPAHATKAELVKAVNNL